MAKKDSLKEYRARRDFSKSPEPSGTHQNKRRTDPIFVIQKHDARKGPSTDPRIKRAAFPTEDHPLDYATFEGIIPAGEYGGGTVMVWDLGTYKNLTGKNEKEIPIEKALENGHVSMRLDGKKLKGGYSLTRVAKGEEERWLLVKMRDEEADARRNPVSSEANSALTGRSLEDIAKQEGARS
jgi:hypothetical protein